MGSGANIVSTPWSAVRSDQMTRSIRFLLRAAVSVSILAFIISQTRLSELWARAQAGMFGLLVVALLLVVLMALLVALRWHLLAAWLELTLPISLAVRAVFLGLFVGQLLPSILGLDVVRAWVVAREANLIARITVSIVADRLVALLAAFLLLGLMLQELPGLADTYLYTFAHLAVAVSLVALLIFVLACSGRLKRVLRTLVGSWLPPSAIGGEGGRSRHVLAALIIALSIQGLAAITAAIAAAAYGINGSITLWLSVIPASVIASAFPISINGWGVREAVIIALSGAHGIAPADALLVSLTLGVLNAVASFPGAWLMLRRSSS